MSQRIIINELEYNHANQQKKKSLSSIQNDPTCLSQYFPFHHLSYYFTLIQQLKLQNLKEYIPQFQPNLKNTILWQKFIKNQQSFNLFKEIIKLELFGFIIMIITSILTGGCFIACSYLQLPLIAAIMNNHNGQAWIIMGIMIALLIIKIFLFSYAENLSNNLGTNAKIHFQNTFMKSILQCGPFAPRQKLETLFFYDGNIIRQLFLMIPYMVTSIVQIIGAIIFVFVNFKLYGFIPFGILILMIILHIIIFTIMNIIGKNSTKLTQKRSNLKQNTYKNLIRISFQGLVESFYKVIEKLRQQQSKYYSIYSFLYSIAQVVGDAFPITTSIIVYTISRDNPNFPYQNAIKIGLYISMAYSPIRMMIFGSTFILSAIKSIRNFHHCLSANRIRKYPIKECRIQKGLMIENLGDCFKSSIQQETHPQANHSKQFIFAQIMLNPYHNQIEHIKIGQSTLITGRLNTQKQLQIYFKLIEQQIYQKYTLGVLDKDPFIMEGTIRQNILLTSELYQQTYRQTLKFVQLERLTNQFQCKDNTLISSQSVKSIRWLALRIQLARIIYHNVDFFIIKRGITFEQQFIIKQVMQMRKKHGKTNIIISRSLNFMSQIDYVMIFKQDGTIDRGKPLQIFRKKQLQLRQLSCYDDRKLKKQDKIIVQHFPQKSIQKIIKVQLQQLLNPAVVSPARALVLLQKNTFIIGLLVLSSIAITVILRLYILYLVPRSFGSPHLYTRLLWSSIVYLISVILRGIIVAIYFNASAKQLSLRLLRKFYNLSVKQIFELYNRRQTTNNQIYIANIMNDNFFRDFQAGFFSLFEVLLILIFSIIQSYIVITFVLPVTIIVFMVISIYLGTITNMLLMKQSQMNTFYLYISDTIRYCKNIIAFKKSQQFWDKYTKQIKMNIIFDINQIWAISGQRILVQLILLITFIIVIIVFIAGNIRNQIFMIISIGSLVDLSNIIRYILKLNSHYQYQLVGCSHVLRIIQTQHSSQFQQLSFDRETINKFNKIEYRDLTIKIFDVELCRRVKFTINSGDRIAINGELIAGKQAIFGPLHHIFKMKDILGDILIDDKSFWFCKLQGFNLIYTHPIFPTGLSVFEVMKTHNQHLNRSQLDDYLALTWTIIGLPHTFTSQTIIDDLIDPQRELLYFIEQTMVRKCQLLLISDALTSIDRISLLKLLDYIIKSHQITAIVHLTNCPIIMSKYPHKYTFSKGCIQQFFI